MAKLFLPAQYGAHRSYSGRYTGVKIEGFSKRRATSSMVIGSAMVYTIALESLDPYQDRATSV